MLLRVDVASYEYHAKENFGFAAALRVKATLLRMVANWGGKYGPILYMGQQSHSYFHNFLWNEVVVAIGNCKVKWI